MDFPLVKTSMIRGLERQEVIRLVHNDRLISAALMIFLLNMCKIALRFYAAGFKHELNCVTENE